MATERLEVTVKTRIRPRQKRALERIARRRELALSAVLREAFLLYLANPPQVLPVTPVAQSLLEPINDALRQAN